MKKLLLLCGACALIFGITIGNRAILGIRLAHQATLSVFVAHKPTLSMAYESVDVFFKLDDFYALRIDTFGSPDIVQDLMLQLQAKVVERQEISGTDLTYGYSPLLPLKFVRLGRLVNLMIACARGNVAIGYPLLVGSW